MAAVTAPHATIDPHTAFKADDDLVNIARGEASEAQADGKSILNLTEDERAILDDNSDDWYGLWEVDWWFNAAQPDWPWKQRSAYMTDLVQRGLMEVYARPADEAVLDRKDALEVIQKSSNWLPPTDDNEPAYRVSTTEAGVAALQAAGG